MGRAERRVQKWLNSPPKDAHVEEVKAILKRYFQGKFRFKSGSHIVVRDDRLAPYSGFDPFGEFAIPVKGGQRVKGYYLQRLARAVQIINELGEADDEEP